jgi:hypothetical protein
MDKEMPHWTQQRHELLEWFKDRAPRMAEAYQAAVRLVFSPGFPARVLLVCHIVRDIYTTLPTALGEKSKSRPAEVFPKKVKKLATTWNSFPGRLGVANDGENFAVSKQVYDQIVDIVEKSNSMTKETFGERLARALFRSVDRPDTDYIPKWVIETFDEEYKFFVNRAHLAGQIDRLPTDDGLIQRFEEFERSFHSLVGPYFSGKEELDAILRETNKSPD